MESNFRILKRVWFSRKIDPCRNQEKRASTIDQIKRNELTLLGAQKKNSIQSTDREVML